jgi:hypothetical protein
MSCIRIACFGEVKGWRELECPSSSADNFLFLMLCLQLGLTCKRYSKHLFQHATLRFTCIDHHDHFTSYLQHHRTEFRVNHPTMHSGLNSRFFIPIPIPVRWLTYVSKRATAYVGVDKCFSWGFSKCKRKRHLGRGGFVLLSVRSRGWGVLKFMQEHA